MELRHYWDVFRRWVWLIVLTTVLAAGAAYIFNKLSTPIYRATTTLLISQSSGGASLATDYTSLLTSQQLAKTYVELIQKQPTIDAVIKNLNLQIQPVRFRAALSVAPVRDTTLIAINYEDANPAQAQAIANEVAKVFVQQIKDTQHSRYGTSEDNLSQQMQQLQTDQASAQKALDQARAASPANPAEVARLESNVLQYQTSYASLLKSFEDLRAAEARQSDTLYVAEPAALPIAPVRPQTLTNTLLAAVVGALLAIGLAFLIEYLDDAVKSPDDIAALGVTNMGMVGRIALTDASEKLVVAKDPRSPIAEAFRTLRTNIQFSAIDRPLRVLMVTSAGPGEGKSTVAANLAAALAQAGKSVILLDADLRRPVVHRILRISNSVGLTTALLQDSASLDGVLRATVVENLKAITSGPLPPNPAELLGSERIGKLLDELKKQADVIVIDTPPVLVVTDALALSKRADAVLLVLDAGTTRRDAAAQALQALHQVGANVAGSVLNNLSPRGRSGYYNYQYYYYYAENSDTRTRKKKASEHETGGGRRLPFMPRRNGNGNGNGAHPEPVTPEGAGLPEPPSFGPE